MQLLKNGLFNEYKILVNFQSNPPSNTNTLTYLLIPCHCSSNLACLLHKTVAIGTMFGHESWLSHLQPNFIPHRLSLMEEPCNPSSTGFLLMKLILNNVMSSRTLVDTSSDVILTLIYLSFRINASMRDLREEAANFTSWPLCCSSLTLVRALLNYSIHL